MPIYCTYKWDFVGSQMKVTVLCMVSKVAEVCKDFQLTLAIFRAIDNIIYTFFSMMSFLGIQAKQRATNFFHEGMKGVGGWSKVQKSVHVVLCGSR